MTGYTETIRRYAADDRRAGILEEADGTGEVGLGAAEAGRKLAVRFTLKCTDGSLQTVRFQVFGCGFTIAACAAAAELAEGQALEAALAIDAAAVESALGGLPEERGYCANLAAEALQAAMASAQSGAAVRAGVQPHEEHGPLLSATDPIFRALIDSPAPAGADAEDRHLFACLLAIAARESRDPAVPLGLHEEDVAAILARWFPAANPALLAGAPGDPAEPPPEINDEVLEILLSHVTDKDRTGSWLARALAARASRPGHLWVAMGLFERPELTASIARVLPSLAAANAKKMRWKRYLFKQVCDLHGAMLCKSPNCSDCSDYALCFAPEDEEEGAVA